MLPLSIRIRNTLSDSNEFASKGKNTPFNGYRVSGEVEYTILNGNVVYNKGEK